MGGGDGRRSDMAGVQGCVGRFVRSAWSRFTIRPLTSLASDHTMTSVMPESPVLPPITSVLPALFGPFWFAVPKKKVSPSRRGLKNRWKRLKPAENFVVCEECGNPKRLHQYCHRSQMCVMCLATRSQNGQTPSLG